MAWLSGLILLCSSQFVHLTALARTDMMLCLFITLAIYFFLLAHQDEGRKARYPFLMWSALGLGTLTKGPVALLGLLVVLAFLACRRELGFVKRLRVGWGALLWLGIALAWFLPALAVGGREFYRIVVLNEMAHRVLASGSRVGKGKPVYYLVGHFVSGFLPWCLLVPPALAAFWRSRRDASGRPMLLPVVWLLTVLVFFSIPRGKRADYILPLYPAAAILVAWAWTEAMSRGRALGRAVAVVSLRYALACLALGVGVGLLLPAHGPLGGTLAGEGKWATRLGLFRQSLTLGVPLALGLSGALVALSVASCVLVARRRWGRLLGVVMAATACQLVFHLHFLSPRALQRSGPQKRAFAARVLSRVGQPAALRFCNVNNSVQFYTGQNQALLSREQVLDYLRTHTEGCVAMELDDYEWLRSQLSPAPAILVRSGYLTREETEYVLVGWEEEPPAPH